MVSSDDSEYDMAVRARHGSETAKSELVDRMLPYVAAVLSANVVKILASRQSSWQGQGPRIKGTATAAAGDALMQALDTLPDYDPARSSFQTWVVQRGLNRLRKTVKDEWPELFRSTMPSVRPGEDEDPADLVLISDEQLRQIAGVNEVMAELHAPYRRTLVTWITVCTGVEHGDRLAAAAALAGVTPATFKAQLYRARQSFKLRWERRFMPITIDD